MGSPIMKFLTKRTLPILFGFVSLFSLTIANGDHVQNSDDAIEIESDDIQLRWLDKSTMQIIWSGKEGMEDGSINEDSSDNGLFSQSSTKSPGESDDNSETASSDTTSQPSNTENDMDTNEDGSGTADVEEKVINGELMFLTPSVKFKFENKTTVCRFRGKLENHPLARASVVGCETEEFSFVNINIGGRFYVLNLNNKDGRTWKKIRNPSLDTAVKVRGKRSPYYRAPPPSGVRDFVERNEPRPNLLASREGPPPKAITLPYTLAYDKRLKRYFGSDSRAKKYVADVSTLAEPFLEGESNLGTEVHMKFGDIQFVDENVDADGMCRSEPSRGVKNVIAKQAGNLTPMVIITDDKVDCTGRVSAFTGCAYMGSACGVKSGANIAIVDMTFVGEGCSGKRSHGVQDSAMTFVHEVGHQLGMDHDHAGGNGGRTDGRDCTGEGHMSYGESKKEWSSCSKYDFKNWWNSEGYACPHIEHGTTNCGGHKAPSCKKCGESAWMCNGECTWDNEFDECVNKEERNPTFLSFPGSYWLEDGGWQNSGKYSHLKVTSVSNVDGCNADCAKTPDCVAFTYVADKTRSNCELKNDKGAVHLQRSTNKALVGGMRLLRDGTAWVNLNGKYLATSDDVFYDVDNPLKCSKKCEDTTGCIGWTYALALDRCDLKDGSGEGHGAAHHLCVDCYADVVSGVSSRYQKCPYSKLYEGCD